LEFWITEERHPPASSRWEDVDAEQREALIPTLARMISKVVYPALTQDDEEDDHER
jgi:hypothetical protein